MEVITLETSVLIGDVFSEKWGTNFDSGGSAIRNHSNLSNKPRSFSSPSPHVNFSCSFTGFGVLFLLIVINIDLPPCHSRSIFSLLLVAKIAGDLLLVKILFRFCICIPNWLGFSGFFPTCKFAATSPRSSSNLPLEGAARQSCTRFWFHTAATRGYVLFPSWLRSWHLCSISFWLHRHQRLLFP